MSDSDLLRVWQLVHELSEQLAHNQKITNTLHSQSGTIKTQAAHTGTGFTLRRFNTDISKEVFESELERMNAQVIIENQTLLHENKQLSLLLKEYESTMETIMSKFRNHALAAQQHELTLTRHYETLLLARESQTMNSDLMVNTSTSYFLQRLSQHLRALLRTLAGEDPESDAPDDTDIEALFQALDDAGHEDWALERECEITRLERENEELRALLEIDATALAARGVDPEQEREENARYSTPPPRREHSGLGVTGDMWGIRAPPSGFVGDPQGQQQQLQQPQQPLGPPLQRAMELQPGMRAQGRRSAMFGAPPRGGTHIGRGGGASFPGRVDLLPGRVDLGP